LILTEQIGEDQGTGFGMSVIDLFPSGFRQFPDGRDRGDGHDCRMLQGEQQDPERRGGTSVTPYSPVFDVSAVIVPEHSVVKETTCPLILKYTLPYG
jgi:hypothetical protein